MADTIFNDNIFKVDDFSSYKPSTGSGWKYGSYFSVDRISLIIVNGRTTITNAGFSCDSSDGGGVQQSSRTTGTDSVGNQGVFLVMPGYSYRIGALNITTIDSFKILYI